MDTIVILSADYREGRRFAADIGLGMGAIVPVDASRVQGLRPTIILELPSYAGRRDRHGIDSALRRAYPATHGPAVIEMLIENPEQFRGAAPASATPAAGDPVQAKPEPLPVDGVPGQTTIDDQIALAAVDRQRGLTAIAASPEQAAADAPKTPAAETPTFKPRSRAKRRS